MLKLIEIVGKPITCSNREGTEKIKDIHYKINDIIFHWNYRYISPEDARQIYAELCEYGKALKDLETPDKAKPKQNEILTKLRGICQNLKVYAETYVLGTSEDLNHVNATTRFLLSEYLKARNNNELTPQKILELLEDHKRIRTNMIEPLSKKYNMSFNQAFTNLPEELIDTLRSRYQPGYYSEVKAR